jgi:peptidoglycan/xylan/chitin deacetylase (PgdA/CDA1 family)
VRSFLKCGVLVAVFLSVSFFRIHPADCRSQQAVSSAGQFHVPILLYHRFGPAALDSMTVTTAVFKSQLEYLTLNGFTVIPLRQLIDYYLKKGPLPPPGAVVIVADDGHKSVYAEMMPLVRQYHVPVTLFIYPSAISNAPYAMTWDELRSLKKTGFFDIQSHTFWHPNFKKERKRLSSAEYEKFAGMQLGKAKGRIEREVGGRVDMLAWPFGICDDDLIRKAEAAGYVAAFTLQRKQAAAGDEVMKLPRYLIRNTDRGKAFEVLLGPPPQKR